MTPCVIISSNPHRRAEYVVSMPNMYARGILWGKMVLELGDACTARNERNGFYADLTFKTKGYFSGTYNAIAGRVRRTAGRPSSSGVPGVRWTKSGIQ